MRAIVAIACMLAVPGAAEAEGFFGYGVSAPLHMEGMTDHFSTDGKIGGRFHGGLREGNVALEASFFGVDLRRITPDGPPYYDRDWSTFALGLGLRYFIELEPTAQLYGRAGFDRTWLVPSASHDEEDTMRGFGVDYGAGLELGSRRVPGRWGVRIWLDLGFHHTSYHGRREVQSRAEFATLTAGVNVHR